MKNNNLSSQQIAILETLTNEFIKLNVVPEKKNSVIDFSYIIEETKQEDNFRKQCELERQAFNQMRWTQIKLDAESLNNDLKELGLTTLIEDKTEGFHILPIGKCKEYNDCTELKIAYPTSHYITRCIGYLSNDISSKYNVGIQTCNYSSSDQYFPTFSELINSENFKSKIKLIYQQNLRKNKTI